MVGLFRHSLRSILFGVILLAGLGLASLPASAACVCVGAVTQLIGSGQNGSSVCDCVANKIVGKTTTFPWKLPGITGTIPGASQLTSLVDYFENVFWPRWIAMEQKMKQGEAQNLAATTHTDIQLLDAQQFGNFTRERDKATAEVVVGNLGRTDVACPEATMLSPLSGARVVARIEAHNLLNTAIETRDGSSKNPDAANGLVNFYNKMIDKRNELELCNPEGNNGMDAEWCKNSKPAIRNADVNPSVIEASAMLGNNKEEKNFHEYAVRLKDNLFAFIFTPLRKDQVSGTVSNQVKEVLFDRLKFNTQVSNLELPFALDITDRRPLPGVDAAIKKAYEEQLKLVGIDPANAQSAAAPLYMDMQSKDLSKLSMEEIYFRQKNLDPSEIGRVAGASALNLQNIATYQTFKIMNSLVLLFDIRQELRMTNKLLGTIGSLLAADRHQAIEAKIQSVSTN
ncbi:MAG: hypothetical protein EBQ96_07130 [Proteobacteria bacterium]|nr:hypothetical protein [Pseudomonadota bacterium]